MLNRAGTSSCSCSKQLGASRAPALPQLLLIPSTQGHMHDLIQGQLDLRAPLDRQAYNAFAGQLPGRSAAAKEQRSVTACRRSRGGCCRSESPCAGQI